MSIFTRLQKWQESRQHRKVERRVRRQMHCLVGPAPGCIVPKMRMSRTRKTSG
jgi:hypothetical protein